jgi:hypothetical protein
MEKRWVLICAVLIAILVAAMAGYRIGSTKTTDIFLLNEVSRTQTDLQTFIRLAELLKTDKKDSAAELLENLIDVEVSSLGHQANSKVYSKNRNEIIDTIGKAKAYRARWAASNHRIKESLKPGVDAAFKL